MPWQQQTAAVQWQLSLPKGATASGCTQSLAHLNNHVQSATEPDSLQQSWACSTLMLESCTAATWVLHARRPLKKRHVCHLVAGAC